MKHVYLIRHACPAFIDDKRMCIGITDLPLSSQGKAQAAAMAEKLPPVTAVFSSPLRRAMQTAGAIGGPITVLPGLRELHFGEWDALGFDQFRSSDPTLPIPGAEDSDIGLTRFRQALEAAAEAAPGDFAVVAHGGIIARFLQSITGTWRKPDYTEVVRLTYEDGHFRLQEEEIWRNC